MTTLEVWQKKGVQLHIANMGMLDLSTALARHIVREMLSISMLEPDRTAERTSQAMVIMGEQNMRRIGNHAPFGYLIDYDGPRHPLTRKPMHIVEYPPEQMIIEMIMDFLAETDRNGKPLMSHTDVCRALNKQGIKPHHSRWDKSGNYYWTALKIKKLVVREKRKRERERRNMDEGDELEAS